MSSEKWESGSGYVHNTMVWERQGEEVRAEGEVEQSCWYESVWGPGQGESMP